MPEELQMTPRRPVAPGPVGTRTDSWVVGVRLDSHSCLLLTTPQLIKHLRDGRGNRSRRERDSHHPDH